MFFNFFLRNFLTNIQKNFPFQRLSIKKINILALQKNNLI
jgi:hypothetical protein